MDLSSNSSNVPGVGISVAELVKLCAIDSELFAKMFFPKTFRQPSPPFAKDVWQPLDDPSVRLANLILFRGASKTTRLRVFTAKRISYGMSRTVLYISASERDAIRSVQWLRTQIERNKPWTSTFGLRPGKKWEETQIEIEHPTFAHSVWVLAAGINGSLRGINFDDYRPDLIIVDDPQTDEMAATEEQRTKINDLVLGAVKNSLAPASETPNAKLVMAITPQHKQDVSQLALRDPQWTSRVFPCWTRDTFDSPLDQQESVWPERFPSTELRADKAAAIRRNKLSIFAREMECRIVMPEASSFRVPWLNIREPGIMPPKGLHAILGIDPVPPPSDRQMQKGLEGKDYEAQYVWGRERNEYHLLEWRRSRGHEPGWTVRTAMELARRWRVARIVFDAVAYQRTIQWLLEREMKRLGEYYVIVPVADGMKKFARITSVIGPLASAGKLYVSTSDNAFIQQFEEYGPLYSGLDDDLDATALALQSLHNPYLERVDMLGERADADVEELNYVPSCP